MNQQITFSNVINKRKNDGEKMVNMTTEEQIQALEKIKVFLLSTCRKNSRPYIAINNLSINNLPKNIGIFNRLTTSGYIAGQEYKGELQYIKRQLVSNYF